MIQMAGGSRTFLLTGALLLLLTVAGCSGAPKAAGGDRSANAGTGKGTETVFPEGDCPNCGDPVTPERRQAYVFEGITYGFCSPECIEQFKENPNRKGEASRPPP